jgi:hypothetical protein
MNFRIPKQLFANSTVFSYSLHYVQKHNRALKDSWSIRQTGFYQAHDFSGETNTWVFLQPSIEIQKAMKLLMNRQSQGANDAIESHILFVSIASINWPQHIEFLEEVYMEKVRSKEASFQCTSLTYIFKFIEK